MEKLENQSVRLRPLEPEDIDLLYSWENNMETWGVSNTLTPFSKHILAQFIEQAQRDIYENKQLRLVIETLDGLAIGAVDLFDFDPYHQRAGVGILIHNQHDRQKGFAFDALNLLCNYSEKTLGLHQLYANIAIDNEASIRLFEKCGFTNSGTKKDWLKLGKGWKDELVFQKVF